MLGEGVEDVQVVVDAELARDGEHDGVGGSDGRVGLELLDELVGLGGVGLAEGRAEAVDHADLVAAALALQAEEVPVEVADDREDAAGDRHPRRPVVPGLAPRGAVELDLLALQLAEGGAGRLGEQGRAHEVDALAGGPLGRLAAAGAPPDAALEAGGVRLDPQPAGRTLRRVGVDDLVPADRGHEGVEVLAGDVGAARIAGTGVAEGFPPAQGRLR